MLESNRRIVLVGLLHYRLLQSSVASHTKGEQLMHYECQERRADIILLQCLFLIKKDMIKNASIRIGWVLITRYIINQPVYCCVI